jgi:hypothetical protein
MRLPDKSFGSTSPRFSRHNRSTASSSSPMMIRASEPPMKYRRFTASWVGTAMRPRINIVCDGIEFDLE